ncbi:unnamed protein product [Amoebophrya sp. A25]|nr:unnamed protein product [Amoebophrya sp. A25]|eukprot:GSA25T00000510001.1
MKLKMIVLSANSGLKFYTSRGLIVLVNRRDLVFNISRARG